MRALDSWRRRRASFIDRERPVRPWRPRLCIERRFASRLIGLSIDPPIFMAGIGGRWRLVFRWGTRN